MVKFSKNHHWDKPLRPWGYLKKIFSGTAPRTIKGILYVSVAKSIGHRDTETQRKNLLWLAFGRQQEKQLSLNRARYLADPSNSLHSEMK
ncbi:MAG TPA: hypothetical protein DDW65_22025 [Firmicutes bacterium]|nr:hypothetical protein [Bacillota bacterium]